MCILSLQAKILEGMELVLVLKLLIPQELSLQVSIGEGGSLISNFLWKKRPHKAYL